MRKTHFRSVNYTVPEEYEETPLRDRKAQLPNLVRGPGVPKKRAEFLRDVIALANTARLFGKPAYLIFGLDNGGNILDQKEHLQVYKKGETSPWEQVRSQMGQLINEYIHPALPHFEVYHGEVDDKEVGYMLIKPMPTAENFQVKKRFPPKGEVELAKGDSWIRFGESKAKLEDPIRFSEGPYAYSYAEIPYILPSSWRRYFQHLLVDDRILNARAIHPYQQLYTVGANRAPLDEVVSRFLTHPTSRVLILQGQAGSGKTIFLRRLVADWAESGLVATEEQIKREEFLPPPSWIPIYFPLVFVETEHLENADSLATQLVEQVNEKGGFWADSRPSNPQALLEYSDLHWVLCFDGFDEIDDCNSQRRFWTTLRTLLRRYPQIKVILTTRPDVPLSPELGELHEVAPFDEEQIRAFVSGMVEEFEQVKQIVNFLQLEEDLWRLCSVPLYLAAALKELTTLQDFTLYQSLVDNPPGISEPEDFATDSPALSDLPASAELSKVNLPRVDIEAMILRAPLSEISPRDTALEMEGASEEEKAPPNNLERLLEEEKEPPANLGRLLYNIYQNLLQREVGRRILSPADKWLLWEALGEIAVFMDGHRKHIRHNKALEYLRSPIEIHYLLSLGVFQRQKLGGWIGFGTELTKVFFAAAFLLPFVEEEDYEDAVPYVASCGASFRFRMRSILSQMTYADVDPIFKEASNE